MSAYNPSGHLDVEKLWSRIKDETGRQEQDQLIISDEPVGSWRGYWKGLVGVFTDRTVLYVLVTLGFVFLGMLLFVFTLGHYGKLH